MNQIFISGHPLSLIENKMKQRILIIILLVVLTLPSVAQRRNNEPQEPEKLVFTTEIDLKATPVKNQASTGTCWCFATISFLESELIRLGKGEYDLSEMFIVRNNYIDRLKDNYLRRGDGNLGPGSFGHDVLRVFGNDGIVPDEVYTGLNYGSPTHDHSELQEFIDAVAEVPINERNESEQYFEIVNSILDVYLGEYPAEFTYQGVIYTPQTFAASLGLDMDNYVEITSFTHWPFYEKGVLEVPDNWTMNQFYNVPVDEMVEIVDYSLENGYTVAWDADVSESGFAYTTGVAQLTAPAPRNAQAASDETVPTVTGPVKVEEMDPTQKFRQNGYEGFTTTDDHLMHITGTANDQFGEKYYKTKNSWGTTRSEFNGYLYTSEDYFRGKTVSILVNKEGIPPTIKAKLGL